jgi:hypothetical protein
MQTPAKSSSVQTPSIRTIGSGIDALNKQEYNTRSGIKYWLARDHYTH